MMNQKAIQYLEKDRLLHIDMLEPLRLKEGRVLHASDDGVLLYHDLSTAYMISGVSEESIHRMAGMMQEPTMIVLHQPFLKKELEEHFSLNGCMECYQAAYFSQSPLPLAMGEVTIAQLTEDDLPFVIKHYTHLSDDAYLLERIQAGMLGAYVNGAMAGFVGTHAEGTIGLLEVLPEYRRQGIAKLLEGAMANKLLAQGRIPYSQIVFDNEASLALHRSLGMEITPAPVLTWLY